MAGTASKSAKTPRAEQPRRPKPRPLAVVQDLTARKAEVRAAIGAVLS